MSGIAGQQRASDSKALGAPLVLTICTLPDGFYWFCAEEASRQTIDMRPDDLIIDALINSIGDNPEYAVTKADADNESLIEKCWPELGLIHLGRDSHIRQQRPSGISLTFEFEAERLAHDAIGAVSPNKEISVEITLPLGEPRAQFDSASILLKSQDPRTKAQWQ